jgi:hypothetical protein
VFDCDVPSSEPLVLKRQVFRLYRTHGLLSARAIDVWSVPDLLRHQVLSQRFQMLAADGRYQSYGNTSIIILFIYSNA